MGLFSFGKPVPGVEQKNKYNQYVNRINKDKETLFVEADKADKYFKAFEDMLITYKKLDLLQNSYNWKKASYHIPESVTDSLKKFELNRVAHEKEFIDRAYERLKRDCVKLTNQNSISNRYIKFFAEFEMYYKYLTEDGIEYIKSLREESKY